jgi:hypothetical protein
MSENNPYLELVEQGMMSMEEMNAKLAAEKAEPDPIDREVVVEGDPDPIDVDVKNNGDDPDPEADPNAVVEPFYKSLGFEKDDDVVLAINDYKAIQSRMGELQAREVELKEKANVLAKFENPYSHETIGKLDRAYEQLKIEDFGLLGRIVSTTKEGVSSDPIQAIVIGKILNDPSILDGGITFQNLMDLEKDARGDIDYDDVNSLAYMRLKIEANQALTKINTFQQSLSDVKGRYTFAHEEAQAAKTKRSEQMQVVSSKAEELMKSGKQKFSVKGYELDLTFNKEEIGDIVSMASRIAVDQGLDLNTTDGVKAFSSIVQMTAKGAAVRSENYEEALIASVEAKANERLLKEQSLGKPNPRTSAAGTGGAKKASESEAYFAKLLREAGN